MGEVDNRLSQDELKELERRLSRAREEFVTDIMISRRFKQL